MYSVAGAQEKGPVWERSFEHIFGTSLRNVRRVEYAEYVDSIELILVNCIGIKVPLHSRIRLLGRARTDMTICEPRKHRFYTFPTNWQLRVHVASRS